MVSLNVIVVFLLGGVGLLHAECPLGWHHYDQSCYFFSTEKLSWYIAESSCRAHNARLAEIETKAQSDYLINMARQLGTKVHYWLGGRDDVIEGTWQWASSDRTFDYTVWGPGEPGEHRQSNCVDMHYLHNWLWSDDSCSAALGYICEKRYPYSGAGQIIG